MPVTITTLRAVPRFARGLVRDLRPRWALEEEGVAYTVALIDHPDTKAADFRARQPFGQVPLYADEMVELFESGAICLHIAERGTRLLPGDPAARARAVQWTIAALNSVEPWIIQKAMVDVFEADRPWSAMRRSKVLDDLRDRLAAVADALGDRPWLDGEFFTVGDLMMISVLAALRGSDALAPFPNLAAYVARGEARPAYARAMADQLALYGGGRWPQGPDQITGGVHAIRIADPREQEDRR